MSKLFKLSLLLLLSASAIEAIEDHQVGFKLGLTSIDNEDGWNFEKGTFFTDLTFDTASIIKPRIDFGYINIDEKDEGKVDSVIQFVANGIYDIDLKEYTEAPVTPYLLGGLGYEYVFDEVPAFESHTFIQAGVGARYRLNDRLALVTEFRALQMFGDSDEDNEFAFMLGFDVPLFVEVVRAPIQNTNTLPAKKTRVYEENIVADDDQDGVPNSIDKCLHTPIGDKIDKNGCTIVSSIVIPEDVSCVKKDKEIVPVKKKTVKSLKRKNLHINFESNSAVILASSKGKVKSFADYLKAHPNLSVTIEGYTDNSGLRSKNMVLSKKRAEAVRTLLIKYGVKPSKIKAVGKGDLNPIADNETASGRAKNRRIEAVIH
jgi:OOP family OmpA-OmpF porin